MNFSLSWTQISTVNPLWKKYLSLFLLLACDCLWLRFINITLRYMQALDFRIDLTPAIQVIMVVFVFLKLLELFFPSLFQNRSLPEQLEEAKGTSTFKESAERNQEDQKPSSVEGIGQSCWAEDIKQRKLSDVLYYV